MVTNPRIKIPPLAFAVGSSVPLAGVVFKTQSHREHRETATRDISVPSVSPCFKSGPGWFGRERLSGLARLRRRWIDQQRCLPSGINPPIKIPPLGFVVGSPVPLAGVVFKTQSHREHRETATRDISVSSVSLCLDLLQKRSSYRNLARYDRPNSD